MSPQRPQGPPVWLVAAVGTALTAAFFYPGYLNGDSYWQYQQGLSGQYNDWHPVIMSWIWHLFDRVIEGSGGLFLVTAFLFWIGLAMFARAFTGRASTFLAATFLVGLSPPIFPMLSQIHKDVGMATGLLLGWMLLVRSDRSHSWRPLLLALPALWYAVAVRHNGASAVIPFTVWMTFLAVRDQLPDGARHLLASPLRKIALGSALAVAFIGTSTLLGRAIVGEQVEHARIEQVLFTYDLIGISVRAKHDYLPSGLYADPPLQLTELRKIYRPYTSFFVYWGVPGPRRLAILNGDSAVATLARAWTHAIRSEPFSYAKHRIVLFLAHLGIGKNLPWRKLEFPDTRDAFGGYEPYKGPTVFGMPHNRWLIGRVEDAGGLTYSSAPGELWAKHTGLLFRPWPYLLLSLLCVLAAWRTDNAQRFQISLLGTSSLLYIFPYLVIGVSADFRYMFWPILVSLLQPILFVAGVLQKSGRGSVVEGSTTLASSGRKSKKRERPR